MAVEVLLPKLGLTMEEGVIEEWLVEAGSEVHVGDPLMSIATDKVNVEVEAEDDGIFHPAVPSGSTLKPGAVVGWLLTPDEAVPSSSDDSLGDISDQASVDSSGPARAESAAQPRSTAEDRFRASPNARRVAREAGVDITTVRGTGPSGRVITLDVTEVLAAVVAPGVGTISPLVRRDAAAAGVDLRDLVGSGPGGQIRRADMVHVDQSRTPDSAADTSDLDVIPLTGMRGVIASRMHASLHEMAQLTLGTDVVMDAAVALRARLKVQWAQAGLAVPTLTDLIVRSSALALRAHPRLNASVVDNSVHVRREVHVGVAVALEDGLLVPVVRHADRTPLSELAAQTRRLAEGARANRLGLDELEGGTFTVTTLGSLGVDFFTPVITPGQVAILGVGRLRDSVRWDADQPVRTQVLTLSLTFDHRAVDGAPAAEYLRDVVTLLENPLRLLA